MHVKYVCLNIYCDKMHACLDSIIVFKLIQYSELEFPTGTLHLLHNVFDKHARGSVARTVLRIELLHTVPQNVDG